MAFRVEINSKNFLAFFTICLQMQQQVVETYAYIELQTIWKEAELGISDIQFSNRRLDRLWKSRQMFNMHSQFQRKLER
jgi:hypothetical protein